MMMCYQVKDGWNTLAFMVLPVVCDGNDDVLPGRGRLEDTGVHGAAS